MDPIQTLLQTLEGLEDSPLHASLRSLLERAQAHATATNRPRTASLREDGGDGGVFPLEEVFEQRYVLGEELGTGAMGTVYRALDQRLSRSVAIKVLHASALSQQSALSRFLREARVTGSLHHPGIVAIHDVGVLADGRPFYAMREVHGLSLTERIEDADRADPAALRRLVSQLLVAAEALAYAHAQGVVHRDVKPDNIMVGDYGDVAVVDWGLARTIGEDVVEVSDDRLPVEGYRTLTGRLAGSPAYMPPEQACGEPATKASDVYALGASLYQVLTGEPPLRGLPTAEILLRLRRQDVPSPPHTGPMGLRELCRWAMQAEPGDRPADAGAFAAALRDWSEGRRSQARADAAVEEARTAMARAAALHRRSRMVLEQLGQTDPRVPADREARWSLEDQLADLQRQATLHEVDGVQKAQVALAHLPGHRSARRILADYYATRHREAEAEGQDRQAAQWEAFLRSHDDGAYAGYLRAEGTVTLRFDSPVVVQLNRVVDHHRKRGLEPVASWRGDLQGKVLPIGSYVAVVHGPAGSFRVPVYVRREEHESGIPPHGREPRVIRVPEKGEIGPEERYVPGGWFIAGGDPLAQDAEPASRRWVGDFVMRAYPVTNAEYLAFLKDLMLQGMRHRAERYAPLPGRSGVAPYVFGAGVRLRSVPGEVWRKDTPVVNVPYEGATAFAAWVSENTGQWWRLPSEDEWEKAARGVDGRVYPTGDDLQAVRVNCDRGDGLAVSIFDHVEDESVYGICGLAGNARTWCRPARNAAELRRMPIRGGGFATPCSLARSASRDSAPAGTVRPDVGIRLVRPLK